MVAGSEVLAIAVGYFSVSVPFAQLVVEIRIPGPVRESHQSLTTSHRSSWTARRAQRASRALLRNEYAAGRPSECDTARS